MKKIALFISFFIAFCWSCGDTATETSQKQNSTTLSYAGLNLQLQDNPEWQYENLRLYPVIADEKVLKKNAGLPLLTPLSEGMQTPGFRVTERKQFGRERDAWYNALTVQNKSDKTIFLMSGDVVTGGNQDRVIAYDDIIPPATVKNIDVFCVEAGRSSYYNPGASDAEKEIAAFRGYYNVASPEVRRAVHSGNQQDVWSAVDVITSANDASSETKTYAALETENAQKDRRLAYQNFFEGKFSDIPDVVGVVAVSNSKVIGVDIFGQPELFKAQFKAILHGYIAEAVTELDTQKTGTPSPKSAFRQVAKLALKSTDQEENAGKFALNDAWVHLFLK